MYHDDMLPIADMNAINLMVRDLASSLSWYAEHFGFSRRYDVEGGVLISVNGVELILSQAQDPNAPLADPEQQLCIHTIGFEVASDVLDKIGSEFPDQSDIVWIDQKEFRSAIVEDPNGYCIELFANKTNVS